MVRYMGIAMAGLLLAGSAFAKGGDVEAIKDVVTRGYVEGIHKDRDPEKIRSGFHREFVMFINTDEGILKLTRDQWIARIEDGNRKNPDQKRPKVDHEFSLVDVAGDAAVARVELHRDGKHTFTDYLSLYRFDDGWRIIGKIFQRHP